MSDLNYSQIRTIAYSVAKSALKVMPKGRNPMSFVAEYTGNDKTLQKALREAASELAKTGAKEGIQVAIDGHINRRKPNEIDIFNEHYKANELRHHPERYSNVRHPKITKYDEQGRKVD